MPVSLSRRGFLFGCSVDVDATTSAAVAVIGRSCLARSGVACQLCRDVCEVDAIRFSLAVGRLPLPVVDPDRCSACGDCTASCPVSAITLGEGAAA